MARTPLSTTPRPEDQTVFITEPEEGGLYLSQTEYRRRRLAEDLKKDPLADIIAGNVLLRHIRKGHITVLKQGGNIFIDWNKYHNFVFKRYRQAADTSRKKA